MHFTGHEENICHIDSLDFYYSLCLERATSWCKYKLRSNGVHRSQYMGNTGYDNVVRNVRSPNSILHLLVSLNDNPFSPYNVRAPTHTRMHACVLMRLSAMLIATWLSASVICYIDILSEWAKPQMNCIRHFLVIQQKTLVPRILVENLHQTSKWLYNKTQMFVIEASRYTREYIMWCAGDSC